MLALMIPVCRALLFGATVYMLVRAAGLPVGARIVAGMGTAVALRQAAWTYDLRLPTYGTVEGAAAAAGKGDDGRGMRPPLKEATAALAVPALGPAAALEAEKKGGLFGFGKK